MSGFDAGFDAGFGAGLSDPVFGSLETWDDVEARMDTTLVETGYRRAVWSVGGGLPPELDRADAQRDLPEPGSYEISLPQEPSLASLGASVARAEQLVDVLVFEPVDHRLDPEQQRLEFLARLEAVERTLREGMSSAWAREQDGISISLDPEGDTLIGVIRGTVIYDLPLNAA
jgi:hypothetical protein